MLNNPTPEQCFHVANTLRQVTNGYHLDMGESNVCGTFLCHGGAYYVAKIKYGYKRRRQGSPTYYEGAMQMAQDLGFEDPLDLKIWAANNPEIWG